MFLEETAKLESIESLKSSLEEAEIIRSGMKMVLMNPSLNPERKGEYEKAFSKLNDEIRDLKTMMGYVRKRNIINRYKIYWD
ncbi:MAG TPA: hypothetical protein VEF33_13665 [Syntrophales bacterium]|nr:hypothetical protein [Syntrophales bacterium]